MQRKNDFMKQDILNLRKMLNSGMQACSENRKMSLKDFHQQLKQILDDELERKEWEQNVRAIHDEYNDGTAEAEKFKALISKISGIISNIESYMRDLQADIYMGYLRADANYDVEPDDLMIKGWDSEAYNKRSVDIGNARLHYPLQDYGEGGFPFCDIYGGCREYHRLMMQQKNIGFFDIDSKKESLKQYAFPKTHEIYQELADSPIENLLLLEKTQGIGYTNQLFSYLKGVRTKGRLEELWEIIKPETDVPMFIRKNITYVIWTYLDDGEYTDTRIQYVKDEINSITFMIRTVYRKIWEFAWQKFVNGEAPIYVNTMKGTLTLWWREYFSEAEVYEKFVRCRGMFGIISIEDIKRRFAVREEGIYSLFTEDDYLAREINRRILQKRDKMKENQEKPSTEKILTEVIEELKDEEQKIWNSVDPKRKTKELKPMDVYAMLHAGIVKILNEQDRCQAPSERFLA